MDERELLNALAALADSTRLGAIALLRRRPHFAEEMAESTGVSAATMSHHLRRLADAGLVEANREGAYRRYSLRIATIEEVRDALDVSFPLDEILDLPAEEELSARVLQRHLDPGGRLLEIPKMARPRGVVLRHIAERFREGRLYPEREVRAVLLEFSDEVEELQQALIDEGLISGTGKVFRRAHWGEPT